MYMYIFYHRFTPRPLRPRTDPIVLLPIGPPVNQPHKIVSYSPTPTPVAGPLNMQCYAKSR